MQNIRGLTLIVNAWQYRLVIKENATSCGRAEAEERGRESMHGGAVKIDTGVGWRVSLLGSFVYR